MEAKKYTYSYSFENGFTLSNCLLYYLGWYHKSGDYWADLKKCVEADGFYAFSEHEITMLFLVVANEWNKYAANNGYKLIPINALLLPDYEIERWKKIVPSNPEKFAMIWKLLGIFAFDYSRTELGIKKPHFGKKNVLKPNGYLYGRTYTEANRAVDQMKNWK